MISSVNATTHSSEVSSARSRMRDEPLSWCRGRESCWNKLKITGWRCRVTSWHQPTDSCRWDGVKVSWRVLALPSVVFLWWWSDLNGIVFPRLRLSRCSNLIKDFNFPFLQRWSIDSNGLSGRARQRSASIFILPLVKSQPSSRFSPVQSFRSHPPLCEVQIPPLLLLLLPSVFPALLPFFPLLSLPAATQRIAFPPHRLDPPAVIRKSRLQSDSNTRAAVTFLLSWTTVPVFTSRAGSFNLKQLYLSLISAGWQWAETLMNF